jgi:hypothetical protein
MYIWWLDLYFQMRIHSCRHLHTIAPCILVSISLASQNLRNGFNDRTLSLHMLIQHLLQTVSKYKPMSDVWHVQCAGRYTLTESVRKP